MSEKIEFVCEGKCRICPYPGANCKTISLTPVLPEGTGNTHKVWMDPALREQIKKQQHIN